MTYRGLGRRGGAEDLWPVTFYASDLGEPKRYRLYKRGRIFDGTRYPAPWSVSWEVAWVKGWRRWQAGVSFETVGYNDEHYGLDLHVLPLSVYLHLDTHGILPKPTKEREWRLVASLADGAASDISVHFALGPGGINPAWKDRQGRRRVGVWHLLDWLLGRNVYASIKGEPYDLDIPLPERSYRVRVTPSENTWTRPRWPRWPFTIRHRLADINGHADPLPEPGNDESDFWNGEDAIFGLSVEDGTPRQVAQRVADRVMEARKRHGAGYDWRPSRSWQKEATK